MVSLDDQWHDYYKGLEDGQATDPTCLALQCMDRQVHKSSRRTEEAVPPLEAIPSLCDVEELLRRTAEHKSPGLSEVPTSVFHHAAAALSPVVFELMMKVYITGSEPIQWKGGILTPIYKRGPWNQAESYRAIMLLPSLAKRLHACLRSQLCAQVAPQRPSGVLGGFPHQEVHFGAQYLRTRNAIAEGQGESFGVLFVDIKNAFHHVIREQLTGVEDNGQFQHLVDRLQVEEDVKTFLRQQDQQGILQDMGIPGWLTRLLAEVHQDTWYVMRHDGLVHKTGRGTRPGSPIADLCFHVLMIDIMKQIEENIADNLWLSMYTAIDKNFLNVVWADDVAIPCQTKEPSHLPLAIKRIAQIVGDAFRVKGFVLSFAKGKTSAVLALRGPGAPEVRSQYLLGGNAGIDLDGGQEGKFLHFVPQYKHLGVQFVASNAASIEIDMRLGQAKQAFYEMKRPIFTNRHIRLRTRLKLMDGLIFSRLSFGQCAWPDPTVREMGRLRGAVSKMYRDVVGQQFWQEHPQKSEEMFGENQLLDIRVRLARDRLQYAGRLYCHGPPHLLQALEEEEIVCKKGWRNSVREDLRWLCAIVPHLIPEELMDNTTDLDAWTYWWKAHPQAWRKLTAKAVKQHLKHEEIMVGVRKWHFNIFRILEDAGIQWTPHPFASLKMASDTSFPCDHCQRTFSTPQGRGVHLWKAHGRHAPEWDHVSGSTCPACMKHFWTTARLYQHLSYIPRSGQANKCFAYLQSIGHRVTEHERHYLGTDHRGHTRVESKQIEGPRQPHLTTDQLRLQELELEWEQHQTFLAESGFDREIAEDFSDRLCRWFTAQTQEWFKACQDSGYDHGWRRRLQDLWTYDWEEHTVDVQDDMARVFLYWGQHHLEAVTAEWEDGRGGGDGGRGVLQSHPGLAPVYGPTEGSWPTDCSTRGPKLSNLTVLSHTGRCIGWDANTKEVIRLVSLRISLSKGNGTSSYDRCSIGEKLQKKKW